MTPTQVTTHRFEGLTRTLLAFLGVSLLAGATSAAGGAELPPSLRLPDRLPPVVAFWGWRKADFVSGGFKEPIEMMGRHSGVNLLIITIRTPGDEVTKPAVHDQARQAAEYASQFGIRTAMDLDIRLAREPFREAYPDELQEMLRLREAGLKGSGEVALSFTGDDLSDHYTGQAAHYVPLGSRLVRVYAYQREAGAIRPESVRDITAQCTISASEKNAATVSIRCDERTEGYTACAMVAFTHLAVDAFAPHLLPFQRKILESYRDVPFAGACKDEWGFPPCFDGNPAHNDYWFSRFEAQAYAEARDGRDLVRDCLLMAFPEAGREAERLGTINRFNEFVRLRHAAIEADFYDATKSVWGPNALVTVHPTWWPYPDRREFKKNGLDWWIVKRDLAQVDEITPYCVRTALAKKWQSPVWYNMFYATTSEAYQPELWADALTGGRVDYHPLYPFEEKTPTGHERYRALLRGGLMRGDCRARLMNFITRSPLDCPVAVVFGQTCAMNWAGGAFDDVGMKLSDALWREGYPADLIPSDEIRTGALSVSADGFVHYGPQCYRAVVLYHPDLEPATTAEFFRKAATGKTALYRVGEWTRDYDGKAFDGSAALPEVVAARPDPKAAAEHVVKQLAAANVQPQAKADRTIGFGDCQSVAPPAKGQCRLLDGTHIVVSGAVQAAGDPIQQNVQVGERTVAVDAVGLFAIRFDRQGRVDAFAAGGLKSMDAGEMKIELPDRADIAMWRDEQGKFHGVLQDCPGEVPAALRSLADDWLRLSAPSGIEEGIGSSE